MVKSQFKNGKEIEYFGKIIFLQVREFLLTVRKDLPMPIKDFFEKLIVYLSTEPTKKTSWNHRAPNTIEKLVEIRDNPDHWFNFYWGLQNYSDAIDMDFEKMTISSCFK